ncbi:MAG: hypothetical protein HY961_06610 [Ignavibacteriae bacterium]|nr:hypothetical protein [Ignavibacteriota bacterium]
MSLIRPTRWFLFVVILIVARASLVAQSNVITIERADSLIGRQIDGEQAQELVGNVALTQDRVHVACDHAIQFKSSGNVQLMGNVVIVEDSLTMRFPRGIYYRDERRAVAYDSVHLDDGRMVLTARFGEYLVNPKRAFFRTNVVARDAESRLTSDSLVYYRLEQRVVAFSNVEIKSFPDNLTIRGHHFESFRKQDYSRMTESPVLVQIDTAANEFRIDTLVVRSRVMEAYRGDSTRKLIATDSVEIIRRDLASTAGLAVFYTQQDSILLRKKPVVWYERTQVSGDSIDVFLLKQKLDRVRVMGSAMAISQSDSLRKERFDQITGDELMMRFGESGLQRLDVVNQAISVYHLYEDSLANGLNKTSGDRITMLWEEKKLSSIRVYGGIEGQYFPENLVQGKETDFALAGFVWRESKPVLKDSDFTFPRKRTNKK